MNRNSIFKQNGKYSRQLSLVDSMFYGGWLAAVTSFGLSSCLLWRKWTRKPQGSSSRHLENPESLTLPSPPAIREGLHARERNVSNCCRVHLPCAWQVYMLYVQSSKDLAHGHWASEWQSLAFGPRSVWLQTVHPVYHVVWKLKAGVIKVLFQLKGWFKKWFRLHTNVHRSIIDNRQKVEAVLASINSQWINKTW